MALTPQLGLYYASQSIKALPLPVSDLCQHIARTFERSFSSENNARTAIRPEMP
jgi:hypothetical protein